MEPATLSGVRIGVLAECWRRPRLAVSSPRPSAHWRPSAHRSSR
jgi:hypothetical protein